MFQKVGLPQITLTTWWAEYRLETLSRSITKVGRETAFLNTGFSILGYRITLKITKVQNEKIQV